MAQLQNIALVKWMQRHPRLAAWTILSVGMVVLLLIEAKDVGLLAGQWAALIIATVLVAGACVWIISWEDKDEEAEFPAEAETDLPAEEKPSV
jgi:hypothetical protein